MTPEELRESLAPPVPELQPAPKPGTAEKFTGRALDLARDLVGYDEGFDQSGVPDLGFRAKFSLLDTPKERQVWLTGTVGKQGWTQDKYGNYALTKSGMEKLGFEGGDKPTVIDEPMPSRYDIADIAGSAPAIAGGVGAGMMASGVGMLPGMALTGLGVALGKAAGETAEGLAGMNIQTPGEIATDVAVEGAYGAAGEGIFRGILAPTGRKILAPYAKRMTPEARQLTKEATEIGARPKATQVTRPPLLGRMQSMTDRIFGDPLAMKNAEALNAEVARLAKGAGPKATAREVGEHLVHDIKRARGALSRWAGIVTSKIDDMTGGAEVVPTKGLKASATDIVDALPKTAEGVPTLTPPELLASLSQISDLPENVTVGQMQAITQRLWDAVDDTTIIPGISGRHARTLWKSATQTYDDIADDTIRKAVQHFRNRYRIKINRFDNALVKRIMLDPKYAGALAPERIVESVFKKGAVRPLRQLKNVVTPGKWAEVRRAAMDDILSNISRRSDDPLVEIFAGKNFLNALDGYGKDTLQEMFGAETTKQMYRLGSVTQFVTQRQAQAGGLVAAHIALHPLRNLGRLVQLNVMSRFLSTPFAMRWLTEGLEAPNTRAGAAALSRAAAYTAVLAEQHTQEPQFAGETP